MNHSAIAGLVLVACACLASPSGLAATSQIRNAPVATPSVTPATVERTAKPRHFHAKGAYASRSAVRQAEPRPASAELAQPNSACGRHVWSPKPTSVYLLRACSEPGAEQSTHAQYQTFRF